MEDTEFEAMLNVADAWIGEAAKGVTSFWRSGSAGFWRDTRELTGANPREFYPTATFLCGTVLEEHRTSYQDNSDPSLKLPDYPLQPLLEHLRDQGFDSL